MRDVEETSGWEREEEGFLVSREIGGTGDFCGEHHGRNKVYIYTCIRRGGEREGDRGRWRYGEGGEDIGVWCEGKGEREREGDRDMGRGGGGDIGVWCEGKGEREREGDGDMGKGGGGV